MCCRAFLFSRAVCVLYVCTGFTFCFRERQQRRHPRWSKFALSQTEACSFCGISFCYSADTLPVFTLTRSTKEWCFSLFPPVFPDAWKTTKINVPSVLRTSQELSFRNACCWKPSPNKQTPVVFFFSLPPHICVSSLSFNGYDFWEIVCSGMTP